MSLPPSSPRLPSPPPAAEIQIGPKSPMMGPNAARQVAQMEQTAIDTNAKRRIHPGTKSADMAAGPPLVPLHELDSAFQLQEHLAALHYYHTASHTTPISRDTARVLATPPPGIDKTLWLYELCRFLIAQCNTLIVGFLFDTPPCSAATCPEMRAGEWQFLCAVHDTPKSCCAIDYCCHTLDWAANVVTNPKIFPSRFVVDSHDKNTAVKNLVNVFRRLHRIFAHAWFQHRGVFWSLESQSGLYVFFKTVCDAYDLLPAENYKLPPEAEGLDSVTSSGGDLGDRSAAERRPQPQQQQPGPVAIAKPPSQRDAEDENYSNMSRTNTRRHIKSSPSVGSAVTTVPEADEDDNATDLAHGLGRMHISAQGDQAEDDGDSASIPVIVEHRHVAAGDQPIRPSSVIPPPELAASESQPKPGPASETAKHETETPEHDFASEPELQSLPISEPEPAPPAPEPAAQPEPEPEAQDAPLGEAEEQAEEQPAAEEPAPETEEPEQEEETAPSGEAGGEDAPAPSVVPGVEGDVEVADVAEQTEEKTESPVVSGESQAADAQEDEEDEEDEEEEEEDDDEEEEEEEAAVSEPKAVADEKGKGEKKKDKPEDKKPAEEKAE